MEITKVKPECHRKMLLFVVIITRRIKTLPGPPKTHPQTDSLGPTAPQLLAGEQGIFT